MPMKLLVNLPSGFFETAALAPVFERLAARCKLERASHDDTASLAVAARDADLLLMWAWPPLDEATLGGLPRLRWVGHLNATQAQVRAELARGIAVSEARRGWSPAVAEMALTLVLCGLRKVSNHHAAMRAGSERWECIQDFPRGIHPEERQLSGRNVGVVGFGGIGQRFAELCAPFRVRLRVHDPFVPREVVDGLGAELVTMAELCRHSEVVVLCAADNAGTRRLFSRESIAALPRGALVVNVGRASLVDSEALFERLERGEIFAALDVLDVLDVFDVEPLPQAAALRKLPNAWLAPPRAGAPLESVVGIMSMLAAALEAFLEGRPRPHAALESCLHALHG